MHVSLTNNTAEEIQKEILDSTTCRLIAKANGLSDQDFATVQLGQYHGTVVLYQIGDSDKAFRVMQGPLREYVDSRNAGHTRDFCLTVLTNRNDLSGITNADLRAFLKARPMLPADRVKCLEIKPSFSQPKSSGSRGTNSSPSGFRMETGTAFYLIDGAIAWEYHVQFKPDGSVDTVRESRSDANEYDPKMIPIIQQAYEEALAEMKPRNPGQLGFAPVLWWTMKAKLKAKGIDWYSPADLNPNTRFD